MKDHPIIFSAPMVLALLEGRKTMTRRLAWRTRVNEGGVIPDGGGGQMDYVEPHEERIGPSPWQRVKPGDRLWVRENWSPLGLMSECTGPNDIRFAATADEAEWAITKWRPSIHMPRWASRLTLVVTAVKIERVQDISEADAQAEGMYRRKLVVDGEEVDGWFGWNEKGANTSARGAFEVTWCGLHGLASWEENHEIVALNFAVHKQNVDARKEAA